jgi:hypothetical protein
VVSTTAAISALAAVLGLSAGSPDITQGSGAPQSISGLAAILGLSAGAPHIGTFTLPPAVRAGSGPTTVGLAKTSTSAPISNPGGTTAPLRVTNTQA